MQFYLLFSSIAIYFYKKVHTNLFGRSPNDAIFIYYSILFIYTTESALFNYLACAILLFMEIYNIGLFIYDAIYFMLLYLFKRVRVFVYLCIYTTNLTFNDTLLFI